MAGSSCVLTSATPNDGEKSLRNSHAMELLLSFVGDDATGAVPTLAVTAYPGWWITKVVTNPGTTAPTTLYDITFVDVDGFDIMEGALADRSATATETETMATQIGVDGFTVTIANQSAASAIGTIRIFLNR
jgi:hypothetical protein